MDKVCKKAKVSKEEAIIKQSNIQCEDKKGEVLTREFYSQGVVELAKALIGKIIVRDLPEGQIKAIIVETEAYKAPEDKACHAYNNKKTERTQHFWQDGGHLYVYSIYGSNNCMNITARDKDHPEAVLIRAVQPIEGEEIVRTLRKTQCKKVWDFTNGPGKVGMALAIDRSHNSFDLTKGEKCFLIDNKHDGEIVATKRINIDYAEEWKEMPWRFILKDNKYVSKGN